jgi:hypothetical protein
MRVSSKLLFAAAAATLLAASPVSSFAAQPHTKTVHAPTKSLGHGHGGSGHVKHAGLHNHHNQFHGIHNVHGFNAHQLAMWKGGLWHHEFHGGRMGWWWDVGGVWYFYAEPVYPFPEIVSEVVIEDESADAGDDAAVDATPVAAVVYTPVVEVAPVVLPLPTIVFRLGQ